MTEQVSPWNPAKDGLRRLREQNADGSYTWKSTVYNRALYGKNGNSEHKDFFDGAKVNQEIRDWHQGRQKKSGKGELDTTNHSLTDLFYEAFGIVGKDEGITEDGFYVREIKAGREDEKGRIKPNTLRGYRSAWRDRIADQPIAKKPIRKLVARDGLDYLTWLETITWDLLTPDGIAPKTANSTWAVVGKLVQYWQLKLYRLDDPFAGLALVPSQKPRRTFDSLEPSEIRTLVIAVLSTEYLALTDTNFQNAMIDLILNGGRVSETCGRRWSDVNTTTKMISTTGQLQSVGVEGYIPARALGDTTTTKSSPNGARERGMPKLLFEALRRQRAWEWGQGFGTDDDFCYTRADAAGVPINRKMLYDACLRAGELAGLGHVIPQMLRISDRNTSVRATNNPLDSAYEGGHDAKTMFDSYLRPSVEKAQERAQAISEYLGLDDLAEGQS